MGPVRCCFPRLHCDQRMKFSHCHGASARRPHVLGTLPLGHHSLWGVTCGSLFANSCSRLGDHLMKEIRASLETGSCMVLPVRVCACHVVQLPKVSKQLRHLQGFQHQRWRSAVLSVLATPASLAGVDHRWGCGDSSSLQPFEISSKVMAQGGALSYTLVNISSMLCHCSSHKPILIILTN